MSQTGEPSQKRAYLGPDRKSTATSALRAVGSDRTVYIFDELKKRANTAMEDILSDRRLSEKEMGNKLIKLAKINQCGPDETDCPNGCCPHTNWYCCPDSFNCAATAADCAFEAKNNLLVELVKSDQCGPDETLCPTGCCPGGPHWFCCHDDFWPGCAPTAADCP